MGNKAIQIDERGHVATSTGDVDQGDQVNIVKSHHGGGLSAAVLLNGTSGFSESKLPKS